MAAPASEHEITANWTGNPMPTTAPYGQPVTAEWHVNTNDVDDPYSNEPVDNVRATLTVGNGDFTSIPTVCKIYDVTPVSAISADGSTLLCNLGTVKEGTATVIQTPVRATSTTGGNLTMSGTVTSDSAIAVAGPADPGPLPITYSHGMDLTLAQAPGTNHQGIVRASRLGGNRPSIQMNFSIVLEAGSRPGPVNYSFPVTISGNVAGATNGLAWEGCVPVSTLSLSTGQPFSDPAEEDRTNFPTCSVSGSGTNYTVSLSNLDYTLVNAPVEDSLGQPLPGNGVYIASGTVRFSIPAAVTQITTYTFAAAPGAFVFTDGVSEPDSNAGNNTSSATLTPSGAFSNHWIGTPTASRSVWDANLWVSPGTSYDVPLPQPGIDTEADYVEAVENGTAQAEIPLYHQANILTWNNYQGPGGPQMAGVCTMNQNPAFVPTWFDGGGWNGGGLEGYENYETARFFYTTQAIDTKTETCSQPAPSAKWIEVVPAAGKSLTDPRIGSSILMALPAGVTAVKMTWNPAVDRSAHTFLRAFGHIDPNAPTSGEGWTTGAFNAPYDVAASWPGFPTQNNWVNISTYPTGGTIIPGSTYGPNTNGARDAYRLQGAEGLIEKTVSDTTAQPGIPVTYTLRAQAQNYVTSPPPATFTVVDTLPEGMAYVPGSAVPAPTNVSTDGRTLTWTYTNVAANVFQTITYEAQRPADSVIAPGTRLTNVAVINVVGDNRPANTPGRTATAYVVVPSASATVFGKSAEAGVLAFEGDSSAWVLTINSQDPVENEFTDTIDILPAVGDGRGTNIDGGYTITGVDAPSGSTVYYSSAPLGELSTDPRDASNGGTPGSIAGNTVGWSTTAVPNPTAIRVIAPELAPGASQTIRIEFTTPAGSSCEAPAAGDNKPGQVLVNSAGSYAGHTRLPMLSTAQTVIGSCYAANLKKYVQDSAGAWHDANTLADYPVFRDGDTVRYRIVVENVGQGTLTNLEITDDQQPELGSFTVASLARGETETHEFEITADAAAGDILVNTACGTADAPPAPESPATINCDEAGFVVDGEPTHVKSLISATPIGSGRWQLVYGIDVSNESAASTSYSLDDTLHFTDQATITSATVTAAPAGVTLADPAWDGQNNLRIAEGVPLPGNDDTGYAPHHYEVTVVADVPLQLTGAGAETDDPTECGTDADDADRAFNNTSTLTDAANVTEDDQACAPIPSIEISKGVTDGPTPNGDGTWTVTYDVVATNKGAAAGVYDVEDRMIADGDMTVQSAAVTSTPAGVLASPTWTGQGADGAPENVIATGVTLAADSTHTYQIEVVVGIDPAAGGAPVVTDCSATGGTGGLSNSAEVEHNDLTDDAEACITIAFITIDKSISDGPTPNGDGTWSITYDLVAENIGAAAGDYELFDQLRYGTGIDIVSADVVTSPSGVTPEATWTGEGATLDAPENLVADAIGLDPAQSHTYQVEVVVEFDESTIDPSALACPPPGSAQNGALANSTSLGHNGIVALDETCAALPLIRIAKSVSAGPVGNGDGTFTITYDLVATNVGGAEGDYDLADQLRYGAGIVIESAGVVTPPAGVGTNPGWTGEGADLESAENQIVEGIGLAAGAGHTYQVQVVVSLDQDTVTPATLACPAPGSGDSGGLSNTTRLTHNGESADDDACASLPLIDITKSISGAVVPVAGQPGVYDITYEVTATNSGPGAGSYDLDDQLQPGGGIAIVGIQSVTTDAPAPVGLNPAFDGVDDTRVVTAQPIAEAPGAPVVHTYTIVVRYSADFDGIEIPAGDECTDGSGPVNGALNNVATVDWNGIGESDEECVRPGKPTLDKAVVSNTPIGDGLWEVVYDLTVGNVGNEPTGYDVDDEFLFAADVTVDSIAIDGPEGVTIDADFDGAANQRIATGVTIPGIDDANYLPHVYRLTVTVAVPLAFAEPEPDGTGSPGCTAPAGDNTLEQGLNNAATLTDENGNEQSDTDCAGLPAFAIAKQLVGSPQLNGDSVTTEYEIVITNVGAATGEYVLRDQLRYGAGLTVDDVAVTNAAPGDIPTLPGFTGQGAQLTDAANQVTDAVTLAAQGAHTYRTVVTATMSAAAVAAGSSCGDGSDAGGVRNVAVLEHNGLTDQATVCADLPARPTMSNTGIGIGPAAPVAVLLLMLGAVLLIMRRRRGAMLG